jgi:hypothetical protein
MVASHRLRLLAAAAAGLQLLSVPVAALPHHEPAAPQARDIERPAAQVWVSVASGEATTVTPILTVTNGQTSTLSGAPSSLTATGTYTLTPSGTPTTSTGLPPVATATDTSDDGAFLACTIYTGEDAPFCQPENGTPVNPGKTYYSE